MRKKYIRLLMIALLITSSLVSAQKVVSVDYSQQFQKWDGYGGFGAQVPWWDNRYQLDEEFVSFVLDSLRFTVFRTECLYPADHVSFDRTHPEIQDMQAAADRRGVDIKWITSIWSAPPQMKDNNNRKGGKVRSDQYEEFGEYAANWCVDEQFTKIGIHPYAVSLQNEPNLNPPPGYSSGVYTAEEYNEMLRVSGTRFKELKPEVKLFGPEGALPYSTMLYAPVLANDPVSAAALDAIASHAYWTKINLPVPGLAAEWEDPTHQWQQIAQAAGINDHSVWQTEVGGWVKEWKLNSDQSKRTEGGLGGLLHFHSDMFIFHRYGNGTLWVHWQLGNTDPNDEHIMFLNGKPNSFAYMYRHYSAFIRPGAIRVESSLYNDDLIFTNAWYHPHDNSLTLTLLNLSNQNQTIRFEADSLPAKFNRYVSADMADNCKFTGSVASSSPLNLPAQSITTLYGTFPGGPSSTKPQLHHNATVQAVDYLSHDGHLNLYDLRGRVLSGKAVAEMIKITNKGKIIIKDSKAF